MQQKQTEKILLHRDDVSATGRRFDPARIKVTFTLSRSAAVLRESVTTTKRQTLTLGLKDEPDSQQHNTPPAPPPAGRQAPIKKAAECWEGILMKR